jgi:hypothetical protein
MTTGAARTLLTLGALAFASIAGAAEMNAHFAPTAVVRFKE